MFKAIDIANFTIVNYPEKGISNLKLQKLLYLMQGVYLAEHKNPLFGESIIKWKYGPVVQEVYRKFRTCVADNIVKPTDMDAYELVSGDTSVTSVVEYVMTKYGDYSAAKLVGLTHQHDPWINAELDNVIPKLEIQKFFEGWAA